MHTFDVISHRRSIRKFLDTEIPRYAIERVLQGAILAPSSKNRQPWKFIIISGNEKHGVISAMERGINNEKSGRGLLPSFVQFIPGAEATLIAMREAPVTIFIFNTEPNFLWRNACFEDKIFDVCNIQSIGAAIQNMLLVATDMGIGSLWICDVFFAYRELCEHFGQDDNQLIAAVSLGYYDDCPPPRPRKPFDDVVQWGL